MNFVEEECHLMTTFLSLCIYIPGVVGLLILAPKRLNHSSFSTFGIVTSDIPIGVLRSPGYHHHITPCSTTWFPCSS